MSMINLTPGQLRQAADLKERIASLNQELTAILGGSATPAPAARAKMAAAAKQMWVKIKAAKAAKKK